MLTKIIVIDNKTKNNIKVLSLTEFPLKWLSLTEEQQFTTVRPKVRKKTACKTTLLLESWWCFHETHKRQNLKQQIHLSLVINSKSLLFFIAQTHHTVQGCVLLCLCPSTFGLYYNMIRQHSKTISRDIINKSEKWKVVQVNSFFWKQKHSQRNKVRSGYIFDTLSLAAKSELASTVAAIVFNSLWGEGHHVLWWLAILC